MKFNCWKSGGVSWLKVAPKHKPMLFWLWREVQNQLLRDTVSTAVPKWGSKEREGTDSLAAIHCQTWDSLEESELTRMIKNFCYSKLLHQEAIYLDYQLTVWEEKQNKQYHAVFRNRWKGDKIHTVCSKLYQHQVPNQWLGGSPCHTSHQISFFKTNQIIQVENPVLKITSIL